MAGQFSDAGSNIALDALTGRATQTAATTYIALLTAAPSDTTTPATMTEYGATGYARQSCAWGAPALNGSSVPETANTGILTFGPFTAGTGATVAYAALVEAVSGTTGVIRNYWTLDTARTPGVGDSITVAVGGFKISVD